MHLLLYESYQMVTESIRLALKLINLTYEEHLNKLKMYSLKDKHLRGNLIETCMIPMW